MKRGILIDVVERSVTEIDVTQKISHHLRCDMIDVVMYSDSEDIYVDDSWRFNTENYVNTYFEIEGVTKPICSNGLILGIDHQTGKSVNTTLSLEEVKSKIKFLTFVPTPKNKGFVFVWK